MPQTAPTREDSRHSLLTRLSARVFVGWRRIATVAATGLAIGFGYHVIFGQNGLTTFEQKRQEERSLETQLKDLQRENEALKGHVDHLQNDPTAIEHQAREELHYTRPGEVIYTLQSSGQTAGQTAQTQAKP
jgi:cell division protein FtsB